MPSIDSITTGNDYSDAATISGVWNSNGGFFSVVTADVWAELQWGEQGQGAWTEEVHVPVGPGQLYPGTSGIRFRSYTAGSPASVSASIAPPRQPTLLITASGTVTVPVSNINGLTGRVRFDGSILAGTGFTVVHTGLGIYTITFTPALASIPVVVATAVANDDVFVKEQAPLVGSCRILAYDITTAGAADTDFNFIAILPQ